MKLKSCFLLCLSVVSLLFVTSCATNIRMANTTNPPPSEAFQAFTVFVVEPVTLDPAYAKSVTNNKALAKIQERLSAHLGVTIDAWNRDGTSKGAPRRTLVIKPVVTKIKFIGGAARFMVGNMAGSSAVIVNVTVTEKETGKTVSSPEFYASANGFSGGWTVGVTDNLMLDRIAGTIANYIKTNYASAVGGVTGAGI